MQTLYVSCPTCKTENLGPAGRCSNCGTILPISPMPMQPYEQHGGKPPGADKKVAAGVVGILLGGLGIHKFILGYTTEGIIMLVTWILGMVLLCGVPSLIVSVIGIVEGIMYLTKSDEEFSRTYIQGKKAWF